jgi:hypothetical protein
MHKIVEKLEAESGGSVYKIVKKSESTVFAYLGFGRGPVEFSRFELTPDTNWDALEPDMLVLMKKVPDEKDPNHTTYRLTPVEGK